MTDLAAHTNPLQEIEDRVRTRANAVALDAESSEDRALLDTLIAEELRRLDVDDIFASAMGTLVRQCERDEVRSA